MTSAGVLASGLGALVPYSRYHQDYSKPLYSYSLAKEWLDQEHYGLRRTHLDIDTRRRSAGGGGGGKVRQLFQARRAAQGWDRSQPLEPIHNCKGRGSLPNLISFGFTSADQIMDSRTRAEAIPSRLRKPTPIKGREVGAPFSRLGTISKGEVSAPSQKPVNSLSNSIQKREITSATQRNINSLTNSISKLSTTISRKPLDSPPGKVESRKKIAVAPTKASPGKRVVEKPQPARTGPPDPNFVSCSYCKRYFDPTRIVLHEKICAQAAAKKRKPFDAVKHRLEGTEAETYLRKPKSSILNSGNDKAKKNTWRKKHEEFISIVRAAREAQAHVAKGGKLSDLPPPPSMTTDELIPCPHCGRKFNEAAAERHIPKCANIKSRPKPVPKSVPRKR